MVPLRFYTVFSFIVLVSNNQFHRSYGYGELDHIHCSMKVVDHRELSQLIAAWNSEADNVIRQSAFASWNWAVNITDENAKISRETDLKSAAILKKNWREARCIKSCENCSADLRRQLLMYQMGIGAAALTEQQLSKFQPIMQEMKSIYSKAKVCGLSGYPSNECFMLDPGVTELMRKQGDYCFLSEVWKGWRDASGKKIRDLFSLYVEFMNLAALKTGYKNAQEMWLVDYVQDSPNFLNEVFALWEEVKPFYQQLHAYVRTSLVKLYGKSRFPPSGHIPAHLLGNLWAQSWDSLINLVLPEPETKFVNLTDSLIRNQYSVQSMFKLADEFFQSIGMDPMTDIFWEKSVFTKQPAVDMICHASAWDLNEKDDFRIKMCTIVDGGDFQTVHNELGHICYYQNYAHQPRPFRSGANPGFHEAVGDLISISAMNPLHLKALGLVSKTELNAANEDAVFLNMLMQRALAKIAFLPFALLVDLYRYGVFNGSTPTDRLNTEWWKLRCSYQGVSPPVVRSEDDFDPGSKYHVPASSQYINYFVAAFLQFDFHESICRRMGFTDNFHKCDIWRNPKAASILKEMLSLGKSKPYPEILKLITGRNKMSAGPMLRFFKPLHDWLVKENAKLGETVGWDESMCPMPTVDCA